MFLDKVCKFGEEPTARGCRDICPPCCFQRSLRSINSRINIFYARGSDPGDECAVACDRWASDGSYQGSDVVRTWIVKALGRSVNSTIG